MMLVLFKRWVKTILHPYVSQVNRWHFMGLRPRHPIARETSSCLVSVWRKQSMKMVLTAIWKWVTFTPIMLPKAVDGDGAPHPDPRFARESPFDVCQSEGQKKLRNTFQRLQPEEFSSGDLGLSFRRLEISAWEISEISNLRNLESI